MTALLPDLGRDELVPAASVDDLIAAVQRQLDDLEAQVRVAHASVLAAEARVRDAEAPGEQDGLHRVREAVRICSANGRASLDRAVAAARVEAAARVAEAHAEAATVLAKAGHPVRPVVLQVEEAAPTAVAPAAPVLAAPPAAAADEPQGDAESRLYADFWAVADGMGAARAPSVWTARRVELLALAVALVLLLAVMGLT